MKKLFILMLCVFSFSALAQEKKGPFDFLKKIFQKKERTTTPPKPGVTPTPKPATTTSTSPASRPPSPTNNDDSLANTLIPKFYRKRSEPVFNVALMYYGDYYNMSDLDRIQDMLEDRFYEATGQLLKLKVLYKAIYPFKHQISDYPDYRQNHVTEIDRLQRLWYYDNVGVKIVNEVYNTVKNSPSKEIDLNKIDALLVVTGAQFDALGFASGRVAITENPMEIAWGNQGGGRVEYVDDAKVVDELLHEAGHTLFLDHASNQCQKPGMTYAEKLACCEKSAAKDDVMSYCRQRNEVNENFFYGFKDCNRRMIKNKIIPAMLSGGKWTIEDREKCD